MKVGPVAFLFVVATGWAAVRAVMLWPETNAPTAPRRIAWQPPLALPLPLIQSRSIVKGQAAAKPVIDRPIHRETLVIYDASAASALPMLLATHDTASAPEVSSRRSIAPIFPPRPASARRDRFSISAWAIVRGEAGPGLASAGQLGGSQAGLRARYELGSGLAAAMRVSGPFRSRLGKEVAVALDWRPIRRVPVTVTIERRMGLDRGGRDAFVAGLFGGGVASLPLGLRADGYAQVGLVGLKRRDAYVDGAARLERPLIGAGRFRLAAGAGIWGGAQPGASRLDIGPQLVAHVPVGGGDLRIGAEWRFRVAGHARPGSGPALSIGADF